MPFNTSFRLWIKQCFQFEKCIAFSTHLAIYFFETTDIGAYVKLLMQFQDFHSEVFLSLTDFLSKVYISLEPMFRPLQTISVWWSTVLRTHNMQRSLDFATRALPKLFSNHHILSFFTECPSLWAISLSVILRRQRHPSVWLFYLKDCCNPRHEQMLAPLR